MFAISSGKANTGMLVVRYWKGRGPLWRIFWLYGVLFSLVLSGVYAAALRAGDAWAQQVLLPILFVYTLWIVVSVWRCAPNTRRELHTHLARGLTVAWAINAVLVLGALQFELVARYLN